MWCEGHTHTHLSSFLFSYPPYSKRFPQGPRPKAWTLTTDHGSLAWDSDLVQASHLAHSHCPSFLSWFSLSPSFTDQPTLPQCHPSPFITAGRT